MGWSQKYFLSPSSLENEHLLYNDLFSSQLEIEYDMSDVDYVGINLHEAGEYVPPFLSLHGSEYKSETGLAGMRTERRYMLELTQMTYLNQSIIPCQSEEDHVNVSQCIEDYVLSELGCR